LELREEEEEVEKALSYPIEKDAWEIRFIRRLSGRPDKGTEALTPPSNIVIG